jgi:hypothetical protein
VVHSLPTLVRQRIFQIACGYADQNDATSLRSDPLLKAGCGRLPESGADLASQPTLSRLENAVDRHACEAMAEPLVALYIREQQRSGAPTHLVLDIDATDDPIHGNQEGGAYHGFYREHIYHPLLMFDGQTDQLITAVLRPGRCHESRFVVLILRRLLKRLRAAWPQVTIELRADSGFAAVPRLYAWCEANGLTYTIGMSPNRRLAVIAAPLLGQALAQSKAQGGSKVRLAGETADQARTWVHSRRVVYTAEALSKGPHPLLRSHRIAGRFRGDQLLEDRQDQRRFFRQAVGQHRAGGPGRLVGSPAKPQVPPVHAESSSRRLQ